LDETRFGRPRWVPGPGGGWARNDPWETGFLDLAGGQGLLGQVDGRTTAAVRGWLEQQTPQFRDGVQVVVIDPHAGYAHAARELLPHAALAVDHFHLILLANRAVTAVPSGSPASCLTVAAGPPTRRGLAGGGYRRPIGPSCRLLHPRLLADAMILVGADDQGGGGSVLPGRPADS
jgi:hypothetical protein